MAGLKVRGKKPDNTGGSSGLGADATVERGGDESDATSPGSSPILSVAEPTGDGLVRVVDAKGRKLGIRRLTPLLQFDVMVIMGDAANTQAAVNQALPAACIGEINGDLVPVPGTLRELRALLQRLDFDALTQAITVNSEDDGAPKRAIVVRHPGPLMTFDMSVVLGEAIGDAASTRGVVNMATLACSVAEISGSPVPFPQTYEAFRDLLGRLTFTDLATIQIELAKLQPAVSQEAGVTAAKN
jgi:hypothetical protein